MQKFNLKDVPETKMRNVAAFQAEIKQQYLRFFASKVKELFAEHEVLTSFSWRQVMDYDDEYYFFNMSSFRVNGYILGGVESLLDIAEVKKSHLSFYMEGETEEDEKDEDYEDEDYEEQEEKQDKISISDADRNELIPATMKLLALFDSLYEESCEGKQNLFRSAFGLGIEVEVNREEIKIKKYSGYYDYDEDEEEEEEY